MDHFDYGMCNPGGASHICSALQMLLHIPEVSKFLLEDEVHRKTCRSLLCISCALYRMLVRKSPSSPTFFIHWWKVKSVDKPDNAYQVLFHLITSLRLEHDSRGPKSSSSEFWDCLTSELFSGRQLFRVSCTQCTAVDFGQEFLSVELEDLHDKNLASEVKLKLQEGDEHICSTCNEVTLSWDYLSAQFPNYLIVHATNCLLTGAQIQSMTLDGESFYLQSCIIQTTSPIVKYTSFMCPDGVTRQFEDGQVKQVNRSTFSVGGIPPLSEVTMLFARKVPSNSITIKTSSHEKPKDSSSRQKVMVFPSSLHNTEQVQDATYQRKSTRTIGTQTEENQTSTQVKKTSEAATQCELFEYETFRTDEKNFKSWTGITVQDFEALYDLLGGDDVVLKLKQKYKLTEVKKTLYSRISGKNRLLLFFLRFRQGFTFKQLSFFYKMSIGYLSDLFYVMSCHLYETFKVLSKHMFPTSAEQLKKKPIVMRPFKNLRVILDGVSFFLETPSNFEQQGNTFSTYKHHNVALFIIGISCHGATIFCSNGMEGSMSDKVATLKSNLKELLEEGDCIMVDKGFELQSEMKEMGVNVLRPPIKKRGQFFTKEEQELTEAIAAARIYVEHCMADIKDNRIFKGDIPLTLIPILSKLVYVAAYMRNFSPSRISSVSFRTVTPEESPDKNGDDNLPQK